MGKVAHSSLSARVLKALGIFGSLQMLAMLCAVVRTKLVAIWIGATGVGIISLYNATLDLIKFISSLDINQCAVPEIAKASKAGRAEVNYTVKFTSYIFGTAGALLTLLASPLLSRLTFGTYAYTWGFALLSPTVFFSVLANGLTAILQGTDRLRQLAKATLYGSLAATAIAIPLFYFFRYDAIVPVLITYQLSALAFLLVPHVERPAVRPDRARLRAAVKAFVKLGSGLTLGISIGLGADYLLRVYINSCSSLETVGFLQAGITIIKNYVGLIFTAICMEYFPRLSATIRKPQTTSVIVSHEISMCLWILMPVVVLFIAADELIVRILYSESFLPVMPLLGIAILSTFFRAVSWCLSLVIVAKGDSKRYIISEFVSAASLLLFGIAGWHFYGLAGIGIAIAGQFMVHAAITLWLTHRYYGLKLSQGLPALLGMSATTWAAALSLKIFLGWWAPLLIILPWLLPLAYRRIRR